MGFSIKGASEPHPKEFARLLDKIKNTPYERIISTALLRSLMKAKYSSQNAGHFSLAFEYYCHFTSPIRRYPDLAIHRIIKEFLNGGLTEERINYLTAFTERTACLLYTSSHTQSAGHCGASTTAGISLPSFISFGIP